MDRQELTKSIDQVIIGCMKTIIISEFKAKCIAILKEAQRTREPVIVTRRGKPLVRIEPIPEDATSRQLGALRGRIQIRGDIVRTDTELDWEMLS